MDVKQTILYFEREAEINKLTKQYTMKEAMALIEEWIKITKKYLLILGTDKENIQIESVESTKGAGKRIEIDGLKFESYTNLDPGLNKKSLMEVKLNQSILKLYILHQVKFNWSRFLKI